MPGIAFHVAGRPVPQGSKTRTPQGGFREEAGERLTSWRRAVYLTAVHAMSRKGLRPAPRGTPVFVVIDCWFPVTRRSPEGWRAVTPDADKLARAVLDGMTRAVYADDAQVCDLHVRTRNIPRGDGRVGVEVGVEW